MKTIQALEAQVRRYETDPLTSAKTVFYGWVRFLRPDRADLYLVKETNPPQNPQQPQQYERFLCTGRLLYEFRPKDQIVRVHQLPQRAPGQPALDDNFLGFLFGMEAREAKRRYDLRLVKQDQWYDYLIVRPLMPADKAEFTEARLVLYNRSQPNAFLPRQMIFIPANGTEITWEVMQITPNAPLGPLNFEKPRLLPGWKFVDVPPPGAVPGPAAMPPPSKVRPSGSN
jgi:TIGR03009 family protein